MKRMKRIAIILVCVAILTLCLGCGKKKAATKTASGSSQATSSDTTAGEPTDTAADSSATTTVTDPPVPSNVAQSKALSTFTDGKVSLLLPSDFKKSAETPATFSHKSFPAVTDTVAVFSTNRDPIFNSLSTDKIKSMLSPIFSDVKLQQVKKITVQGYAALRIDMSCRSGAKAMNVTQIIVNADRTYYISYLKGNGLLSTFVDKSVASIKVK